MLSIAKLASQVGRIKHRRGKRHFRHSHQSKIEAVGSGTHSDAGRASRLGKVIAGCPAVERYRVDHGFSGLFAAPRAAHAQAVWQAGGVNNSNYNETTNWSTGNVPDAGGEAASFENVGSTTVVVNATVAPDSWTFQNAPQNYTISGSAVNFRPGRRASLSNGGTQQINNNIGETGGAASVNIVAGSLTLTGTNTYTGATTINAGATLRLAMAAPPDRWRATSSITALSASTIPAR